MAVEASGLSLLLDTIGQQAEAAAANREQLQGLAAGGIVPPAAAPGPTLLQRLTDVSMDGTPYQPPSAGGSPLALPTAGPGYPAAATGGSALPTNSIMAYVGEAAQKRGIDPTTAIRVAMAEGGRSGGYGPGGVGDNGTSFSPFQLHYGGGLGDDFTAATGLHASDPANVRQAVDFALDHAAQHGWSAFHGAARAGIGAFSGIGGRQGGAPAPVNAASRATPAQIASYAPQSGPTGGRIAPALAAIGGTAPTMPKATADAASVADRQDAPPGSGQAIALPDVTVAAKAPAQAVATAVGTPPVFAAAPFPSTMPQPTVGAAPTMDQIRALIVNPATRQLGLGLWQTAIAPKPTFKLSPGEREYDYRGVPVAANPAAPVTLSAGQALVPAAGGAPIAAVAPAPEKLSPGESLVRRDGTPVTNAAPNQELKQVGVDAFGNPSYGTFNPQSGAVAPVAGSAGSQNPITGNFLKGIGLDTSKTGEEFLKQVDPALANTVRAIISGREPPPAGRERNQGTGKLITALVNQVDPQFESGNGPTRNAVYMAYSDPDKPVGAAINAGNSAIAHLGELAEKGEALSSGQFPLLNGVSNVVGQQLGKNSAYVDYNGILGKYAEEVTKFYRGSGGTEADLARDMSNLSPNMSPEQRRSALAAQAALIRGKVGALQSQYMHAMGPMAQPFPILQPHSESVLSRILARVPEAQPGGAPAPAPVPGPPGASPDVPDPAVAVAAAKSAIAAGAPRDAVIQRMKARGLPTDGL